MFIDYDPNDYDSVVSPSNDALEELIKKREQKDVEIEEAPASKKTSKRTQKKEVEKDEEVEVDKKTASKSKSKTTSKKISK